MPLREPLFHEVEFFYAETKKSNAHTAMGRLIEKISGAPASEIGALPLTTLRRGQAYLLQFINHDPEVEQKPSFLIRLDKMITSLNGQEAWESVELREPDFSTFERYYEKLEQGNEDDALLWLMAELSGVNQFALKKLPITRYREAEKYLKGFLFFFPTQDDGETN